MQGAIFQCCNAPEVAGNKNGWGRIRGKWQLVSITSHFLMLDGKQSLCRAGKQTTFSLLFRTPSTWPWGNNKQLHVGVFVCWSVGVCVCDQTHTWYRQALMSGVWKGWLGSWLMHGHNTTEETALSSVGRCLSDRFSSVHLFCDYEVVFYKFSAASVNRAVSKKAPHCFFSIESQAY